MKVVLVLRYLHYLHQKTPKQISDKIQQISDIFQQNISDIFQQTDISMIKSGNRHFGHIQAYFFGLIQHAPPKIEPGMARHFVKKMPRFPIKNPPPWA